MISMHVIIEVAATFHYTLSPFLSSQMRCLIVWRGILPYGSNVVLNVLNIVHYLLPVVLTLACYLRSIVVVSVTGVVLRLTVMPP